MCITNACGGEYVLYILILYLENNFSDSKYMQKNCRISIYSPHRSIKNTGVRTLNTLSSSPLALCQVQKPGNFWCIFSCNPNLSSSNECYDTYMSIYAWATLRCGPCRKLGEPKPRSGLDRKVLTKLKASIYVHSNQYSLSL